MLDAGQLRVLILIAVFAAVILGAFLLMSVTAERRAHSAAVNKRIKLIASGATREEVFTTLRRNDWLHEGNEAKGLSRMLLPLRRNLVRAGLGAHFEKVALAMLAGFAVLITVLLISAGSAGYTLGPGVVIAAAALAAGAAIGLPFSIISIMAEKRRKKMQEQFPLALDVFVRSLRAGHPVAGTLELLTVEMEDPIGSEFGLASDEIAYGAELRQAMSDMAERWDSEDMRMFVVSLSIQADTGGNLAEILDNLAQVIRERSSMLMKVRALSSEGKMTGAMLTILPLLSLAGVLILNPAFYFDVAHDPVFYIGFPLTIVWYLIGLLMIRNMVNLKV